MKFCVLSGYYYERIVVGTVMLLVLFCVSGYYWGKSTWKRCCTSEYLYRERKLQPHCNFQCHWKY